MELAHFGLNVVTVSFLATVFFSLLTAWGFGCQARTVWDERSAQSLSTPAFLYTTFVRAPIVIYGLSIGSLALIINGVIPFLALLPIVIGIGKFQGFKRRDWLLVGALTIAVVVTAVVPCKSAVVMPWMIVSIAFAALQPWEMWQRRSAGVVDLRMLVVSFINSSFWLIYAFAIDDFVLKVINPGFLLVTLASTVLWYRYRRPRGGMTQ